MLQTTDRQRKIILIAAWVAALDCLLVALLFSLIQVSIPGSTLASIWPIPALYFFEIAALAVLAITAVPYLTSPNKGAWLPFPWIAAGIMTAFVILGAFSIGLFLVPALLSFMLMAVQVQASSSQNEPLNQCAYLLLSLFVLVLVIMGTWSLASPMTIAVLLTGIVLLLFANTHLPQNSIWKDLTFFFIGGCAQTLLMYLLLQPHL